MSRGPTKDTVNYLREIARKERTLTERRDRLQAVIETNTRDHQKTVEDLKEVRADIIKQLDEMDCRANGNTGWEHRIVWMLAELVNAKDRDA
jgi:DNA repair ATPase RecN